MFEKGQWVLYGIHGVCRVIGTEKQLVNRKRTEFLVLEPLSRGESRFYLPIGNPTALSKLKTVLSAQELTDLLASPEIREYTWIYDEGQRKQTYKDLINSGDRPMLLRMVSTLYRYRDEQAAAGRKFHLCDENFLRDAEKLLASEIALVLEMTPEDARNHLRTQLQE